MIRRCIRLEDVTARNGVIRATAIFKGPLPWCKEVRRPVFKMHTSLWWRFGDSGEFTPGTKVEALYSAWEAVQLYDK